MFEKNHPSGKDANSAEIFLKTIIYLSQAKFNIDDEIIGLKIIIILSMSLRTTGGSAGRSSASVQPRH